MGARIVSARRGSLKPRARRVAVPERIRVQLAFVVRVTNRKSACELVGIGEATLAEFLDPGGMVQPHVLKRVAKALASLGVAA